jgi:S-adenosylmethionine/arginine decarboxylase-like enzyme
VQAGGATGAVVLAESHLAIHTWPERLQATLDIYVCNVSADNSGRAEALYQSMLDVLKPRDVLMERVWRGKDLPITTPLAA